MIDSTISKFSFKEDYIGNRQLFTDIYETTYGIYNHATSNNPLSSIAFHEAENFIKCGIYEAHLEKYIRNEIHTHLGISFDEYLDRPRYEIESIVRVVDMIRGEKYKADEKALKDLEDKNKKATS